MKSGNITTNHKVEVEFTSPALSTMDIVKWKFPVDDSAVYQVAFILIG